MLKRFFSAYCALICACVVFAYATSPATENSGFLQGYATDENGLRVLLDNVEQNEPSSGQFSVTLNDQPVAVSDVKRASDMPVTYYCLVDISGSLNQEQLAQEKDALKALCAKLSTNDRMVIAPFGNEVTPSGYMGVAEDIEAAIDAIEIQRGQDTNLYGGIVIAIRELQTSNQSSFRKCLVVLTDGEDDQKSSYTQKETDAAIRASGIPFYGVAIMKSSQSNDSERIAYAKILGSFARESAGGAYYNPVLDGISAASVGEAIHADMGLDLQVFLDLSELDTSILPAGAGSVPLKVRYMTDSATYDASLAVDTADLRAILPNPDVPDKPDNPDNPDTPDNPDNPNDPDNPDKPDNPDDPELHFPVWGWIVVAFILIAVLLILYFFIKRRKNVVVQEQDDAPNGETAPEIEDYGVDSGEMNSHSISVNFPEMEANAPPTHKVVFSALNYKAIRLEIELPEERPVTLGRDQRADIILNPQDSKLSGAHCRVLLRNGHLLVWDADSTNGTTVDGVPLRGGASAALENGRTLGVGNYEYRVEIS